jgi:hypothetical protein
MQSDRSFLLPPQLPGGTSAGAEQSAAPLSNLGPRAVLALRVHRGEISEEQAFRELKRQQRSGDEPRTTTRSPAP